MNLLINGLITGAVFAIAARIASTNSRTAPLPPPLLATKAALSNTARTALDGAAANPARDIASKSFTSSPMKQTSLNARPQ